MRHVPLPRRIFGLFMCSLPLLAAAGLSYTEPGTVVELVRESDDKISCYVSYHILFFIPIDSDIVANVTRIDSRRESRYASEILIQGENHYVVLPSNDEGQNQAEKMRQMMADRSQSSLVVRTMPMLIITVFLGGIGGLLVTTILIGELFFFLRYIGLWPSRTDSSLLNDEQLADIGPVPPVVRNGLKGSVGLTKIRRWHPGACIHLHRPRVPIVAILFLGAFGAVLGGTIGGSFLNLAGAIGGGAIGAAGLLMFVAAKMKPRDVIFDWKADVVRWREGLVYRGTLPLSDLKRFEVRAIRQKKSGSDSPGEEFRAQLDLITSTTSLMVIDSDEWRSTAGSATRALTPLGEELAKVLSVPCKTGSTAKEKSMIWELISRPFSVPSLITACLLIALLAGAGWLVKGQMDRWQDETKVKQLGGTISSLSGKSVKNYEVIRNGTSIKFETSVSDEHLAAIADVMKKRKRISLDLSEGRITDAGLACLRDSQNIWSLNLSSNRVTDAGIQHIATMSNLVELSLSSCPISDEGLKQLNKIQKLRLLYLSHTAVTDEGLKHLATMPYLNYVMVGWGAVTPDGVQALQKLLPKTEIVRIGPPYESRKPADIVTAENGQPIPDDGGPMLKVIQDYLNAVHANDEAEANAMFSKTVDLSGGLGTQSKDFRDLRPTSAQSFSGYVLENKATITLTGPNPLGHSVTFRYQLIKEDGQWKLLRGAMQ